MQLLEAGRVREEVISDLVRPADHVSDAAQRRHLQLDDAAVEELYQPARCSDLAQMSAEVLLVVGEDGEEPDRLHHELYRRMGGGYVLLPEDDPHHCVPDA
eukprot:760233-Hanusia_phi.AAC.2